MRENNDNLLAEAWWVMLNSPDLYAILYSSQITQRLLSIFMHFYDMPYLVDTSL